MFSKSRIFIIVTTIALNAFIANADEGSELRLVCAPKADLVAQLKPGFKKEIGKSNYGIFNATGAMTQLNQTAENEIVITKSQNQSVCIAGCHAVGEPIIDIMTQPSGNSASNSCPATYQTIKLSDSELAANTTVQELVTQTAYGFRRVFSFVGDQKVCNDQASNWAKQILTGGNGLGQFLSNSKCQNPCSYASNIRMVTVPNAAGTCATALEINVMCGPPRTSANWVSTASLTNTYQCLVN